MPKMINARGFKLSDFVSTGDAVKLTGVDAETVRRNKHKIRYMMIGKSHAWLKQDLISVLGELDDSFDAKDWYTTQEASLQIGMKTTSFIRAYRGKVECKKVGVSLYWKKEGVDRLAKPARGKNHLNRFLDWEARQR